jgi:putative transcriptional regulator
MTESAVLSGRLLLALPGMGDPRFDHAVIALCVHNAQGAFGVGIGQTIPGTSFHALLDELEIERGEVADCPVHVGGPVEPTRGFVLHSADWEDAETLDAGPLGRVSASMGVLRAIAEGRGPQHWLIALGYAGWSAGQLDNELHHHGWHLVEARPEVLWETPAEQRWTAAWKAEGIDPALLVAQTGRA